MANNESKSPYGMLMAILLLLLPGSWALQLKMGAAKSTSAAGESKDKEKESEAAGGKESKPPSPPPAACQPEYSQVLGLAQAYCLACSSDKKASAGADAEGAKPEPPAKPEKSASTGGQACAPALAAPCPQLASWAGAGSYCAPGHLEASIALLPERGWGLDGALESLIRAHEQAGYTLVRQLLPPRKDEPKPEVWLGGLLFDNGEEDAAPGAAGATAGPTSSRVRQVKLVYLVLESPTEGVDTEALGQAMQDVLALRRVGPASPLRVLGPTFSGSARRLGWLLAKALPSDGSAPLPAVQVVSGTATSGSLVDDLCSGLAAAEVPLTCGSTPLSPASRAQVAVHSLVRSDPEMTESLWRYLTEELHALEGHIAIVTETSTGYGQQILDPRAGKPNSSKSPTCQNGATGCPQPFSMSMWLPIPSGLSHLRAEWAKQGRSAAAQNDGKGPTRTLEQVQSDEGRRSALRLYERSTINARDLSLAALLSSICQEGIRYVGLFLTDAADKEFLAQRITLQCPNVRLFTMESELEYLHAKHYPYMRGALVASTYPLYGRNTQWSAYDPNPRGASEGEVINNQKKRTLSRLQFTRQADQGLYNATLFSLEQPEQMQEYAPPRFAAFRAEGQVRPPVWISAVGRDGLMPLLAYEECPSQMKNSSTKGCLRISAAENPPKTPGYWYPRKYTPYDLGPARLMLLIMSILAFVHSFAFFRNQYGRPILVSRPYERPRFFDFMVPPAALGAAPPPRPSYYYVSLFAPVWAALSFLTLVLALRFRADNLFGRDLLSSLDRAFFEDLGYVLTGVVAMTAMGLALADVAARRCLPEAGARRWRGLAGRIAGSLPLTGLALAVPSALVAWGIYSGNSHLAYGHRWILFLRRSSQTDYELSLLVPTVFLALVGYLWGLANLRRQVYAESRRPVTPVGMGSPEADGLGERPASGRLSLAGWLCIVAGTTAAMIPLLRRLSTIDHWVLDIAFALALWAVAVSVVASLIRVGSAWSALRRQLFFAAHHPISAAIKGLPSALTEPLRSLLTASLSRYSEQMLISKQCQLVHESYADLPEAERQAWSDRLPAGAELPWQRLQASLSATPEREAPSSSAMSGSGSLRGRRSASEPARSADQELAQLLLTAGVWGKQDSLIVARRELADAGKGEGAAASGSGPAERFYRRVQELLALRLVVYLFHVVTPLRETMLFVSGGLILTLLALNSYPFQPAESLGTFTWLLLLAVVSLLGLVLLQMRRDPLLSGLAAGETGKLGWDTGLGKQAGLVIVAPLLTMLATKVPALSWLLTLWQQSGN